MGDRVSKTASDLKPRTGTDYPDEFKHVVEGRAKRALGDAYGLTQFGINQTELAPGAASALRHWHTQGDELVYVLSGELVLVTDAGEETLAPGDFAGFKAGVANGHHLVNRSNTPATYLEIGTRRADDEAHYSDVDLHFAGAAGFKRKDGTTC